MSRIGLDLDGCIADFTGGFWDWAEEFVGIRYPEPTTWRFYEQWGWGEDDFFKAHLDFVKDGGYLDLAVIGGDNTRNALQRLAAAGHTIVLITARGANMTFAEQGVLHRQTADWLKTNHLPHHELHLTDKKTDVPVDWMLDDNLDNYRAMQGAGVDAFLMDQPWNEDQDDFVKNIVRVPSVTEYVDTILAEEQEQTVTGFITKDSGQRATYDSGMQRDTETGKARFDLLHPKNIAYADQFLTRVAELMGRGAEKYGDRNWEKAAGDTELERFYSSAARHFEQWLAGETDEDHAAATVFNLMAAETLKTKLRYEEAA